MRRHAPWLTAALLICFVQGALAQAPAPATAGSATTSGPVATPAPIIAPTAPPSTTPAGPTVAAAAALPQPAPCSSPEARQFDFWVGEWIGTWKSPNGAIGQGTNRIESILGGCVIHENFQSDGPQPLIGRSYSVWSPRLKKWQQTWVDSSGSYLDLNGGFADGKMVLLRDGILGNGKPGRQRMTFSNIRKDRFDWDWDTSEDGGQTWTSRWHIDYVRK
jgi:hypothetical protein